MKYLYLLIIGVGFAACGNDDKDDPTADVGVQSDMGSDVAVTDTADMSTEPNLDALFEPGPEKVGYQEITISYDAPGIDIPREIPTKVWYPADPETDAQFVTYRVGGLVQLPSENSLDAPAVKPGSFPVLVYSHGSGGEGLLAYPFAEHFASHGWVVVSPNHVGNTALDGLQMTTASFAQIALWRVTDITAVIDAMESGPTAVAGVANVDQVMLFGHSFGAYTTLAAGGADVNIDEFIASCAMFGQPTCDFLAIPEVDAAFRNGFGDPRIDAISPQAPAVNRLMAPDGLASIEVPTLLASGRRDQTTTFPAEASPAWAQLDGENDLWLDFQNAGHLSFITVCEDVPMQLLLQFFPDNQSDGCGDDFLPADDVIEISNAYLFAFANSYVLGDDSWADVLDGPTLEPSLILVVP